MPIRLLAAYSDLSSIIHTYGEEKEYSLVIDTSEALPHGIGGSGSVDSKPFVLTLAASGLDLSSASQTQREEKVAGLGGPPGRGIA